MVTTSCAWTSFRRKLTRPARPFAGPKRRTPFSDAQALLDQPGGQRRDDDALGVGILGPDVKPPDELRRFPVQFLGDFLAQLAPAGGLVLDFLGFQHDTLGFQIGRQGLARGARCN